MMDENRQKPDASSMPDSLRLARSIFEGAKPDLSSFSREQLLDIIQSMSELHRANAYAASQPVNESRWFHAAILDHMHELVTLYDTDMKHLWSNRAAIDAAGKRAQQLDGLPCYQIWYHRDRPCDECPVLRALKTRQYCKGLIETPDRQVWLARAFPLEDDKHNIIAVAGIRENITRQKNLEQEQRAHETRIKTLVENIDDLVSLHDLQGNFLFHNHPSFFSEIEEELQSKTIFEILGADNAGYLKELTEEVRTSALSRQVELQIEHQGNQAWFNIHIHPVVDEDNQVSSFACVSSDVTARKQVEKAFIENQARFHSIFENSPIVILEEDYSAVKQYLDRLHNAKVDDFAAYFEEHPDEVVECFKQVRFTNANQAALQLYQASDKQQLLSSLRDMLSETAFQRLKRELVVLARGEFDFEGSAELQNLAGERIHTFLRFNIPPEYQTTWERAYASIIDISELVKANEALEKNQARYHNLFDDSPIAITEEDFSGVKKSLQQLSDSGVDDLITYFNEYPDEVLKCFQQVRITAYNREAYKMFDRPPRLDSRINLPQTFSGTIPQRLKEELIALINGETSFEGNAAHLNARGKMVHTVMRLNIPHDYVDTWERVYISYIDITERVMMENQLKASLTEQEYLLREVHHRVKNNLQVISSLLNLQSNEVYDERDLNFFRASQDRVRSMALIHEKLYRSPSLSSVDFDDYLHTLTSELLHIFGAGSLIHLNVDATGICLPIDSAIPCGLIINELATNALKYAFPHRRSGTLNIQMTSLKQDDNRQLYTLLVSDDGVGISGHIDLQAPASLGLQLVNILTRQLDGKLEISSQPGTTFKITFTI